MTQKPTLLIVEDEPSILRGLTDLFVFHGFDVQSETDGRAGLARGKNGGFSCILLDVMLPSMSGFDVCNALREHSRSQPIIMLTAKNTEQDIIQGLTLGADDYVAKPFSTSELVLRVQALVRRSGWQATQEKLILSPNVSICPHSLCGNCHQKATRFTRREVQILVYLQQQQSPVTREALLKEVWGYKASGDMLTRTVDIHIAKLRKKIEWDPKSPRLLITHRGEGYQLCSG